MASIYERLVAKYGDDALEMLNKMKKGAKETVETPKYPKNITQDVLAEKPAFKMVGEPTSKDFTMVPDGTGLPAIRANTLPRTIEGQVVKETVEEAGDSLLPVLSRNADIQDVTQASKGGLSRGQKLVAAGTIGVGLGGSMLSGDNSQQSLQQPVSKAAQKQAKLQDAKTEKPEQSVAKSQTTGKKSVVDNALQTGASEIESSSRQEDTFNQRLEEARQKDAEQGLLFGLLKAAQMGGAAIAGSKADTSFADTELGKGDQFVNRLKTDETLKAEHAKVLEEQQKQDPNSRISKLMQQSILALKPDANVQGLSAAQVEKIFPSLSQAINMREQIESRKEMAQLQRDAMMASKAEKKEQKDLEFAGKHIDTYTKMLYKDYQGVQQAETNAKRAKDIVANNIAGMTPGAGDIAILYNFIKGLDKNSAVREGEIALSKQARSVLGRLDSEVERIQGGDLLDQETRAAFAELIDASAKAERLNFVKQKRNAIAAGAQKGIDPEVLDKAIFADIPTAETAQKSTTASNKVTVPLSVPAKPGATFTQKSTGKRFRVNQDGQSATEL